jgi:hypothetical protein
MRLRMRRRSPCRWSCRRWVSNRWSAWPHKPGRANGSSRTYRYRCRGDGRCAWMCWSAISRRQRPRVQVEIRSAEPRASLSVEPDSVGAKAFHDTDRVVILAAAGRRGSPIEPSPIKQPPRRSGLMTPAHPRGAASRRSPRACASPRYRSVLLGSHPRTENGPFCRQGSQQDCRSALPNRMECLSAYLSWPSLQ